MSSIERGPRRARSAGLPCPWPRCAAMAVGSVPHTDAAQAWELVLETTPEVPAWPQLPRRSFRENMYVQFSAGLPGLVVDETNERIFVRDHVPPEEMVELFENLEAGELEPFALGPEYAAALPLLARGLADLRPPFVKGQVTGPVSFGLSIPREDRRALLYDDTLREAATGLLAMKARWQEELLTRLAPAALPLMMVDEPYLTQLGSAFVSIPEELAFPLLEEVLRDLRCLRGLHVCGGTDWTRMAGLPLDLLNFDAADHLAALLAHSEAVAAFLREGGLLAWGVVPNDARAWELAPAEVGGRVLEGAEGLAAEGGVSVEDVLQASFVAPACGTGTLPVDLAEHCLRLTARVSAWLREQF